MLQINNNNSEQPIINNIALSVDIMNINDLVTRLFFLTIIYIVDGATPDVKVNTYYYLLCLGSLKPVLTNFN